MNAPILTKWLFWDGCYCYRGKCNRIHRGHDRVVAERSEICLEPGRDTEIPIVASTIDIRVLESKLLEDRVWVRFRLKQPNRVRSILFRIHAGPDEPGPANLVYQEVLDGETVSGLAGKIGQMRSMASPAPPRALAALDGETVSFRVRLWVTTRAGDFETQRAGNRYEPEIRRPFCFPDDCRTEPAALPAPEKADPEPPAEPREQGVPRHTAARVASNHMPTTTRWQAWQAPDPVLAGMIRRPNAEDETPSVIQPAIPEHLRWQAWQAPDPVGAAMTRVAAPPLPHAQPAPMPITKKPEPAPPFIWPPPISDEPTVNLVPGVFRLWLALDPRKPAHGEPGPLPAYDGAHEPPSLMLLARPADETPARQPVAAPGLTPVTARGIRGVVTVDGVHHTELYNYDHPDNLYKAAAFLVKHHFGATPPFTGLGRRVTALVRALLTSTSPLWQNALRAVIPETVAAPDLDHEERVRRYLSHIEGDNFRGDELHLAVLELLLGVRLQVFTPDGEPVVFPLLSGGNPYHVLKMAVRPHPAPRFHPLTEQMPDLSGASPIPYDLSGPELEAVYRDATLSRLYKSRTYGTLIRRVTGFYRISDLRLLTGEEMLPEHPRAHGMRGNK